MKYFNIKKQCAFTLLEILVALSIVVLIMTAVYGSYRATTMSISHCKPRSIIEQQARLFLQRLTSELRCCYAGSIDLSRDRVLENRLEREITQKVDQEKESPLFMSEEISKGNIFLQFVTSSFTSSPYSHMGGFATVSYKLDESGTVLLRNVRKYIKGNDQDSEDYQWFTVLSNIKTISLEYLDDENWQEEWESEKSKILPKAVKVSIVLDNGQIGPLSFESCAYIMCSGFQNSETVVQTITTASEI